MPSPIAADSMEKTMNAITKHLTTTAMAFLLCAGAAHAQTPPKMKMTTEIPAEITTPDKGFRL